MTEQHPQGEAIQDFADDRLTPVRRSELEAHFAACPACARALDRLRWVKGGAAHLPVHEPPRELTDRLAQVLDGEDRRRARGRPSRRYVLATLGFVAAAAMVVLLVSRAPQDLPRALVRDFTDYGRAALPLDTTSDDGPALERWFARHGVAFRTRVFDLGMMGYGLVGARVHRLERRRSALFVYRGADDRALVCQMYEGTLGELPGGGETREHDGIAFRVFARGAVTLVFWAEGTVVCVLVSDLPAEDVIRLAYAKAAKPI